MKGLRVRNEVTGAMGHITGVWLNKFSMRLIINVRPDGMRSGFEMWDGAKTVNAAKTVKLETEKAVA